MIRTTLCAGALASLLCLGLAGTAWSQQRAGGMSDQRFATKAAADGMAEVKLARLALEKSNNPEVKKFAQRMIDDHSKAGKQLTGILTQKNINVPERIDAKHQALFDRLSSLQGDAFDREYARAMLADHEEAVRLFEKEVKNGRDLDLRNFAETTLPTLKEHLEMAQRLAGK